MVSVCESREVDGFKIKTMIPFVCRECKWSSKERVLAWQLLFPRRTSTGQVQVEAINTEFSFMPWPPLLANSGRITPTLSVHTSTIFSVTSRIKWKQNLGIELFYSNPSSIFMGQRKGLLINLLRLLVF